MNPQEPLAIAQYMRLEIFLWWPALPYPPRIKTGDTRATRTLCRRQVEPKK